MRTWLPIAAAVALAGCGTYAVRPEPLARVAPAAPIDLSVSLGDVAAFDGGSSVVLTEEEVRALDAEFVRAARATGAFRDVLPRGSTTDVYADVERRLERAPETLGRAVYVFLVGPIAVGTPGVPYPVDYRVREEVRLRADGDRTTLARGSVERAGRAWLQNFWFGPGAAPLGVAAGESVAAAVAEAVASDGDAVRRFEAARRIHPENAMLLGWLEAQRRKNGVSPADGARGETPAGP
jgi:hypothetical protein